jgi:hypothetical protein
MRMRRETCGGSRLPSEASSHVRIA